jgi:hypothetical protein
VRQAVRKHTFERLKIRIFGRYLARWCARLNSSTRGPPWKAVSLRPEPCRQYHGACFDAGVAMGGVLRSAITVA